MEQDSVWEQPPLHQPDPVGECVHSPTYNNDWHDDVECSNGVDVDRRYLREWDSYITEDEIMQAAREYEDALNG